jgi:hypothetical protein
VMFRGALYCNTNSASETEPMAGDPLNPGLGESGMSPYGLGPASKPDCPDAVATCLAGAGCEPGKRLVRAKTFHDADGAGRIPGGSAGGISSAGGLRLRNCFAPRSTSFVQDDRAYSRLAGMRPAVELPPLKPKSGLSGPSVGRKSRFLTGLSARFGMTSLAETGSFCIYGKW